MLRRAVALVARKAVLRVLLVKLQHLPVTRHLRDDAARGNGVGRCVALYHRSFAPVQPQILHRVDQEHLGGHLAGGLAHRLLCRFEDVHAVDFLRRRLTDADIQRPLHDFGIDAFAALLGELLAIIHPENQRFLGHHDARRDDIAHRRAASSFVHARRNEGGVLRVEIRQQLYFRRAVNLRHRNFPPAACSRRPSSRREWSAEPS